MTEEVLPSVIPPMAYTGLFTTRNTRYQVTTTGATLILPADPKRVYVRFTSLTPGAGTCFVMPGAVPTGMPATPATNLPLDAKFHDCPSHVQGEWYTLATLTFVLLISECLYVGP